MLEIIKLEVKNAIWKTMFHRVRFLGLLIMPFIYGFTYIFAFWSPFDKMTELPIAVVTQKGDLLGDAVGKELSKDQEVKMGAMDMTVKMEHIYFDQTTTEAEKQDTYDKNHFTIVLPELTTEVTQFILSNASTTDFLTGKIPAFISLVNHLKNNQIQLVNNFQKSYLLAFGLDMSSDMSSMVGLTFGALTEAMQDQTYVSSLNLSGQQSTDYKNFVTQLSTVFNKSPSNISIVSAHSYMHEHEKYGFGLAPFFISIGLWVGAMTLTMCFHRKPYEDKEEKVKSWKRYFAKYILMCAGIFVQTLILMVPLYFIGFKDLGVGVWFSMLFFGSFFGMIFGTMIQAIRFAIPNRVVGLFAVIIFLVIQMASAGGLFPSETTNGWWRFWHEIVPMTRTANAFRELAYHPNWGNVFINIAILLIYPAIFIPAGLYFNARNTKTYFKNLEVGGEHV